MSRDLLERFNARPARGSSRLVAFPRAGLLQVGRLVSVAYWPAPGTRFGRSEMEHPFSGHPALYVGTDGRGLWVPDARFTDRGFVG